MLSVFRDNSTFIVLNALDKVLVLEYKRIYALFEELDVLN